jgi:hypothetical protein
MKRLRIKFVVFMGGCELKFRILSTIKNTILLIICSSLLCWQRRNCRADNRQEWRAHSHLVTHRRHLQLCVHLLQLIFLTTPSTSRVPSTSMTPPPAPHASETTPPTPHAAAKPFLSSTTSTGRTSDIKCHHCHGVGHFQHDCPSKKSYIAIDDGGYVSASGVEDYFALQTNNAGDLDDDDAEVFGSEHTEEYNTKTYVVQRVLSALVDTSEKLQRHNLFQIFFIVKDCRVRTIIDGGSCNNLVSADFVAKIC